MRGEGRVFGAAGKTVKATAYNSKLFYFPLDSILSTYAKFGGACFRFEDSVTAVIISQPLQSFIVPAAHRRPRQRLRQWRQFPDHHQHRQQHRQHQRQQQRHPNIDPAPLRRPAVPTMDQEQNQMHSAPQLCGNGCGFYGSPSFDGLCSKCHKDTAKSQDDTAQQGQPASSGAPLSQVLHETSALLEASTSTAQPTVSVLPAAATAAAAAAASSAPQSDSEGCAESDSERTALGLEAAAASPADPAGKKKKSRCEVCRKKVGLTGFTCRCDGLFCSMHRYSDKHGCSFDYRVHGQHEIRKNNPVIVGDKVNKI